MKKLFEAPALSVKEFRKENILTASGVTPIESASEQASNAIKNNLGVEVNIIKLTI